MHNEIKEFSYHISWRSRGRHAGSHSSTQRGMGMEFRGHTTLLSYPDPRRIDIRQTIRDPLEQVHVRIFNQKSATPVFAIADLSGSMNFGSKQSKVALTSKIASAIAMSATHNSDPFGFIGFDDAVREDWLCTQSFRAHQALELTSALKDFEPEQVGSAGLNDVNRFLPRERSLIFLECFSSCCVFPFFAREGVLRSSVQLMIPAIPQCHDDDYNTRTEKGRRMCVRVPIY